jgi:hypothetical protein
MHALDHLPREVLGVLPGSGDRVHGRDSALQGNVVLVSPECILTPAVIIGEQIADCVALTEWVAANAGPSWSSDSDDRLQEDRVLILEEGHQIMQPSRRTTEIRGASGSR